MTFSDAFLIGAVQGITEFLPVSSSAHVVIFQELLDIPYQGKDFDIFLNFGTILAIFIFFRTQLIDLILGLFDFITRNKTKNRSFFLAIFLSSLPVMIIGGILSFCESLPKNSGFTLSIATISFAIVLYLCDQNPSNKTSLSIKDSLLIGLVQPMALLPGVSRLGICLSMMRYLNYSREESFKYSMIMSVPSVLGACFMRSIKIMCKQQTTIENWSCVAVGSFASFIFGLISLYVILQFLKKYTFTPIVIYRILFGLFVLAICS